jgi:hypothetical protein
VPNVLEAGIRGRLDLFIGCSDAAHFRAIWCGALIPGTRRAGGGLLCKSVGVTMRQLPNPGVFGIGCGRAALGATAVASGGCDQGGNAQRHGPR